MNIKHKVLKDFQTTSPDGKIVIIKSGSVLEEYKFTSKGDSFIVDKTLIDNNPEFFEIITWKDQLTTLLKQSKIPQPGIITKKISPFIEEHFILNTGQKEEPPFDKDEYEYKLEKINRKEKDLNSELERIEKRDNELRDKYKELREKEDQIIEKELDLKKLERNINNNSLSHDDVKIKMEKDIEELSKREREFQEKVSKFGNNINNNAEFEKIVIKNRELQAKLDKIKANAQKLIASKPYLKNYYVDIERIFD